ncbi:MAG: NifB/NifX family molybdenum-iron cluster-binding protein [Sulfolobales archaeon]|nr:NifB/NifX family molybdenum-iron cluster-binding protein [Sulfolobales archaeon]MCG2893160.1 NifB/NifX family molybdenum-iron cluster-binding protein [Sulfolobales archaeon]
MKVAVPVSNGYVDGPGEGETVRIYEVNGNSVKLVEEYPNPALTKEAARGLWMLRSALERGATAFLVAEIGPPGFRFLKQNNASIYVVEPMLVEEALRLLIEGKLKEAEGPTHGDHHHHHHHF